jgi:peptidoglycan/xylan/chitin deacetylase (PgdA/CDA1 family)
VGPAVRATLSSLGLLLHRAARIGRGPAIRILYYHSISDAPMRSSVSPEAFAAQLEFLGRRGYSFLSMSAAVDALASPAALPERAIVVTLDDGFRDNYDEALPTLVRLGVPATVFLTAGYIGGDHLPTLTRTAFVPRPLSWEQVGEMQAAGIEFGSHTVTHPMLTQVPADQARRELSDSKRMIEDRLGTAVRLFCYPRGDFDEGVKRLVREAGYGAACTTLPGVNDRRTDRFALRRTYVSRRDTPAEFAKRVAGGYDVLQQALQLRQRLLAARGG